MLIARLQRGDAVNRGCVGLRTVTLALIVLVAPSFARAWEVRIDGTGTGFDQAHAVAIDANGDVIAAGRFHDAARSYDFLVTKRSGVTGAQLWLRWAFGNSGACNCGANERAWAIALTPGGTAFAAGYLDYKTVLRQFAVLRFEPGNGFESWRALSGTGDSYYSQEDEALSVAVDAAGDVVAGGAFIEGGLPYGVVMKLAGGSGAPLWTTPSGSLPVIRAVAVDGAGDVAAVGHDGAALVVTKLSGVDGQPLWRRDLAVAFGSIETVAVDAAGDVFAGGRAGGAYVIKLEGETGETAWERDVVSAGGNAIVNDLVVDGSGDVIAAGEFADAGTGLGQLSVMRLAAATGGDVWPQFLAAGTGTSANAQGVALDSAGDIVVTGSIANTASSGDLAVLKLAGTTGVQRWRRELDNASANDFADDVAVDAADNVVAVGALGTDFAVAKLRGSDGADFPPCGDVDLDEDIDSNDFYALRGSLAGLPPGLTAPGRCSVIGGPADCDILDAMVIRRSQLQLLPGLRSVCADAVE